VVKDGDYGMFFTADQMVWRQNNEAGKKGPALGPGRRGAGGTKSGHVLCGRRVSLLAPLPGRNEDVLAIGAACSKVSHHASQFNQSEMASYKVKPYLL
jgi:hypothetical protein